MNEMEYSSTSVLVYGHNDLSYSIASCLLKADWSVYLVTKDPKIGGSVIESQLADIDRETSVSASFDQLIILKTFDNVGDVSVAIIITEESEMVKKEAIHRVEEYVNSKTIIAINTESIPLDTLQSLAQYPNRIAGLNWTEPAHTTLFLEIITNDIVDAITLERLQNMSASWEKDAYTVNNLGIRSRMMCAMVREAFYLVENEYASIEDIDRACRNDPGYYLPFAGNCRYMDLMGTYAYGLVMKDLNPDLSKEKKLPEFYTNILEKGAQGMENGIGLYDYTQKDIALWKKMCAEFSFRIEKVIRKYANHEINVTNPE